VGDADARDYRRSAEHRWRSGEVVEESNARAEQNGRDVDGELVDVDR
jgi:hypothetical protein